MADTFLTAEFIEREFGGPAGLHAALVESGFDAPGLESVRKYSKRGSMPGPVLAQALRIRETIKGESVRVSDYFNGSIPCPQSRTTQERSGPPPSVFD